MNGHGKLYYETGSLAYEGMWYKDEFHGRGKIYNDEPKELKTSFDFKTFEDDDKYWTVYDGIRVVMQVILCMMIRRVTES